MIESPKMNQLPEVHKQIIFEDNHLLVINKYPGQLVQGDKTGDESLLELLREYIRISQDKPGEAFIGLTHRLDRPCSGIVVYAKTSKALSRMNELFRLKETTKEYLAVVEKDPEETSAELRHYLKKNEKMNKSFIVSNTAPEAKESVLHYNLIVRSDRYSLLNIELITGRHHQIRAQLSHIGCPIKGDLKYGAKRSNPDGSIHLHAYTITFIHPVKKQLMKFTANPPNETLWNVFSKNLSIDIQQDKVVQNMAGSVQIVHVNKITG